MRRSGIEWVSDFPLPHSIVTSVKNMATRESLNRVPFSHLKSIAVEKNIDVKKKKKEGIINSILETQAPEEALTPTCSTSSNQLKENLPPFNAPCYVKTQPRQIKITFASIYSFMIVRTCCDKDTSVNNYKGLDRAMQHYDANDLKDICFSEINADIIYVKASCLSSMKGIHYRVYACIQTTNGKDTVTHAYCQCTVG
ncbi:uncharacterized protein [Argopecten irradians]|uniref:uncharacterized protein n=1 Tax=Argopecten irradians TaxID=31199 RepID=UPI003716CDE2